MDPVRGTFCACVSHRTTACLALFPPPDDDRSAGSRTLSHRAARKAKTTLARRLFHLMVVCWSFGVRDASGKESRSGFNRSISLEAHPLAGTELAGSWEPAVLVARQSLHRFFLRGRA